MRDYFNLHAVLIQRRISTIGVHPMIGLLVGAVAFFFISDFIFERTEFASYLAIAAGLSLLLPLTDKDRTDFIRITYGDAIMQKIRVLENVIIIAPFIFILLWHQYFLGSFMLLLVAITLVLFKFNMGLNWTIPTPFSKRPFEFAVGFRKTFLVYPLAYAVSVVAIQADNQNLGIFGIVLVYLTASSYYSKPEHDYYVWIYGITPQMFLKQKLFEGSIHVSLLVSPIVLGLLIFYPNSYELVLLAYFIGLFIFWTVILAKYSIYPREMNIPEGIVIALGIYFPPSLLVIIPFLYRKSILTLNKWLHD